MVDMQNFSHARTLPGSLKAEMCRLIYLLNRLDFLCKNSYKRNPLIFKNPLRIALSITLLEFCRSHIETACVEITYYRS